jgi:sugar phosphate isomerase/epimerase
MIPCPPLGVCISHTHSAALRMTGWDYIEESVQGFLQAHTTSPDRWFGADAAVGSALPIYAANMMVPGDYKITGPDADSMRLSKYMAVVLSRAQRAGVRTIVFGSGGARQVPDGFDRERARGQIVTFLKSVAPLAEDHRVTIVVEHLNLKECNILNGVKECGDIVRAVGHPGVRLLLDSFHVWQDGIGWDEVRAELPLVRHVHLADKTSRHPPGQNPQTTPMSDYSTLFRMLKEAGYKGRMSIEAGNFEPVRDGEATAAHIRNLWAAV